MNIALSCDIDAQPPDSPPGTDHRRRQRIWVETSMLPASLRSCSGFQSARGRDAQRVDITNLASMSGRDLPLDTTRPLF